jgi:hypothetical protein
MQFYVGEHRFETTLFATRRDGYSYFYVSRINLQKQTPRNLRWAAATDPERTLDEVISIAGNGTLRSYDQQSSLASCVNSR